MIKQQMSQKMDKATIARTVLVILAKVMLARMKAKHAGRAGGSLRWGTPKGA